MSEWMKKVDTYAAALEENAKLKSEVERLRARVVELESGRVRVSPLPDALTELRGAAELEQFGGLVFHQPQATVGPLMSEHGHYWGCPAVTTPGATCDCGAGLSMT